MENNKNKNYFLVVCLLAVVIILLGTYIGYDKFIANNKEKSNDYAFFIDKVDTYTSKLGKEIRLHKVFDNMDGESFLLNVHKQIATISYNLNDIGTVNDVLYFYSVLESNGGCNSVYFLQKDGSIVKFSTEDYLKNKKFTVNKIEGLNNIVTVLPGEYSDYNERDEEVNSIMGPIFIDINGNVYNDKGELIE